MLRKVQLSGAGVLLQLEGLQQSGMMQIGSFSVADLAEGRNMPP